jgi:hypothetical protein
MSLGRSSSKKSFGGIVVTAKMPSIDMRVAGPRPDAGTGSPPTAGTVDAYQAAWLYDP